MPNTDSILGFLIVTGIVAMVGLLWKVSNQLQVVTFMVTEHDRRLKALENKPCRHGHAFPIVLLFIAGIACVLILGACAVGRTVDGQNMMGFTTGQVAATADTVLGLPPMQAIASLVAILGVGSAAHYRGTNTGERRGWDEASNERTPPPVYPPAPADAVPQTTLDIPKDKP